MSVQARSRIECDQTAASRTPFEGIVEALIDHTRLDDILVFEVSRVGGRAVLAGVEGWGDARCPRAARDLSGRPLADLLGSGPGSASAQVLTDLIPIDRFGCLGRRAVRLVDGCGDRACPAGAGSAIGMAVRDAQTLIGGIIVRRAKGERPLDRRDCARLEPVAPRLSRLMRRLVLDRRGPDPRRSLLALDAWGAVVSRSPSSAPWLDRVEVRQRLAGLAAELIRSGRGARRAFVFRAPVQLLRLGRPSPLVIAVVDPERPVALEASHLLTRTQRRVAELASVGATTDEMARHMRRSPHTINHHLKGIYDRLGIGSRAELASLWSRREAGLDGADPEPVEPAEPVGHDASMNDDSTLTLDDLSRRRPVSPTWTAIGLTVSWHPEPGRVGDRLWFSAPETRISRHDGRFVSVDGRVTGPLADPFVSRTPVVFTETEGGVRVSGKVTVDGTPVAGEREIDRAALARGVTLELGRRVALTLHLSSVRPAPDVGPDLVGDSAGMRRLRAEIARAGVARAPVLIRGETGAGKELVARAVHDASPRSGGPYRAVNVAAVPPTVAASAFFGHTRGAFSGADQSQPGYFGDCDGGTLFLDEIGDLSPALQPMLLRALESGEVQPVGARRARRLDVRVIAATDARLEEAIAAGRFSRALLHRLTGVEVHVPPLRERRDDIGRLLVHGIESALRRTAPALGADPVAEGDWWWLDAATVAALTRYRWPGNVRELMNVLRRAVVFAGGEEITVNDLPEEITGNRAQTKPRSPSNSVLLPDASVPFKDAKAKVLDAFERQYLQDLLVRHKQNISKAAREAGIDRRHLYRLLDKYEIDVKDRDE